MDDSRDRNSGTSGLSRRGFLKAAGVGFAGLALPGTAEAARRSGTRELATLLDISQCIGCGLCVDGCKETNGFKFPEPEKPFPPMYPPRARPEDFSENRDVYDRLTPYTWLFIQTVEVEHDGRVHQLNIPRRCLHCQNPPCANMCPFGAARRRADGIVRILPRQCMGGAKCRAVCPWSIPQRQTGVGIYKKILPRFAGNGVMFKCDRCYQRLAVGELPACIEVCPQQLQTIGPREEIVRRAHVLARETGGYIYGETENGGTNTIYVSPVPFDTIDAAITPGPGVPHMGRVEDVMAAEDKLAWAVFAAPVAGALAGAVTTGKWLRRAGSTDNHEEDGHG
jgi:Fe-S-cluster-containing dehydrogenase component